MLTIKIKKTKTGNCRCLNCRRLQEGMKYHPYTVWIKSDKENRGHNYPVCSEECAKAFAASFEQKNDTANYSVRNNYKY